MSETKFEPTLFHSHDEAVVEQEEVSLFEELKRTFPPVAAYEAYPKVRKEMVHFFRISQAATQGRSPLEVRNDWLHAYMENFYLYFLPGKRGQQPFKLFIRDTKNTGEPHRFAKPMITQYDFDTNQNHLHYEHTAIALKRTIAELMRQIETVQNEVLTADQKTHLRACIDHSLDLQGEHSLLSKNEETSANKAELARVDHEIEQAKAEIRAALFPIFMELRKQHGYSRWDLGK